MGKGGSSSPAPAPVPTAGENYASSIKAYLENEPQLREAEKRDIAGQIAAVKNYTPEMLALNAQYSPQYNQQMIDLERQMAPQYDQLQRAQFARTAQQVQDLSPLLRATEDPQTAAIRAQLGKQVESELGMGATLDPSLQREIEQAVRSGQSARGMMRGSGAVSAESLVKGTQAEQLRRNRQQAASNFLQLQASTQQDPWTMITGMGSTRNASPYQASAPQTNINQTIGGLADQQNANNQLNSQLLYNYNSAKAANKPKYGQMLGTVAGGGIGFLLGGPVGMAVGAGIGGAAGGSTGM